ncbi:GTP 3',8-cyclase MoaA [Nocardioides sp. Kera G14]|uniref:GTP 3',8-cyclase MoaA n=1 Tax=Nocardioides sp. Kera G14 TaxID=2884264 RepID=UPI001D12CF1C|nr:GTP 3',8-cyclase MoaA [Nocardioides sp. Kera G14]UDY23330.1 GTP 3',8-cyclase MoaA [Nocardioides sp. Kera G14]
MTGLLDTFGRRATDLRVSLTDKCNLRCTYCMPAEGLPWLPKDELLTDDEIVRLVRIAVQDLGVNAIRFTGGEPLIRPGLPDLIRRTYELGDDLDLSLTTNGLGLERIAPALKEAGLRRLNVSLDTLDRARFHQLTRRDRLDDVLTGLEAAQSAGLTPVKVNAVLMRGVNDDEAPALLRFALERGYELRFIEQMPIDADHQWTRDNLITADEILDSLRTEFELSPSVAPRGSAPAERWLVDGGPATVGVIASVTQPFCRACNRTRLTADGQIRDCLFATTETDLRALLRDGSDDAEIAGRWRTAMWGKARGHGLDEPVRLEEFAAASRSMSAIGG